MTARIPFILDCDPGHDDALALVVGLARPELELLAVTTVAGNAGLDATTRVAIDRPRFVDVLIEAVAAVGA